MSKESVSQRLAFAVLLIVAIGIGARQSLPRRKESREGSRPVQRASSTQGFQSTRPRHKTDRSCRVLLRVRVRSGKRSRRGLAMPAGSTTASQTRSLPLSSRQLPVNSAGESLRWLQMLGIRWAATGRTTTRSSSCHSEARIRPAPRRYAKEKSCTRIGHPCSSTPACTWATTVPTGTTT